MSKLNFRECDDPGLDHAEGGEVVDEYLDSSDEVRKPSMGRVTSFSLFDVPNEATVESSSSSTGRKKQKLASSDSGTGAYTQKGGESAAVECSADYDYAGDEQSSLKTPDLDALPAKKKRKRTKNKNEDCARATNVPGNLPISISNSDSGNVSGVEGSERNGIENSNGRNKADSMPDPNSTVGGKLSISNREGSAAGFLSKFLQTKREAVCIEPPAIEPASDVFFRQFLASVAATGVRDSAFVSESDESDGDGAVDGDDVLKRNKTKSADSLGLVAEEEVSSARLTGQVAPVNWTVLFQFGNLPFKMTAEEIIAFGTRQGYKFVSVVLGIDKRNNLPSGCATVTVDLSAQSGTAAQHSVSNSGPDSNSESRNQHRSEKAAMDSQGGGVGEEAAEDSEAAELQRAVGGLVKALHGADCGGRPLRVQRRTSGGGPDSRGGGASKGDVSRYFAGGNISIKCMSCGEVGHMQRECPNPPRAQPCHLCAGTDHEAGNCPNITCFRCGSFGHHSRDCRGPNMSRALICSHCGSATHDIRHCPHHPHSLAYAGRDFHGAGGAVGVGSSRAAEWANSQVSGPFVRCMSCNAFGHTLCLELPKLELSQRVVHCPNCGEGGHHIDYPLLFDPHHILQQQQREKESGGKRKRSSGDELDTDRGDAAKQRQCVVPKYDAFAKYPQLLRDFDKLGPNKDSYYSSLLRNAPYSDTALFPSLSGRYNLLPSFLPGTNKEGSFGRGGGSGAGAGAGTGRTVSLSVDEGPSARGPPARYSYGGEFERNRFDPPYIHHGDMQQNAGSNSSWNRRSSTGSDYQVHRDNAYGRGGRGGGRGGSGGASGGYHHQEQASQQNYGYANEYHHNVNSGSFDQGNYAIGGGHSRDSKRRRASEPPPPPPPPRPPRSSMGRGSRGGGRSGREGSSSSGRRIAYH